jgi:hypothetical protein
MNGKLEEGLRLIPKRSPIFSNFEAVGHIRMQSFKRQNGHG